MLTRANATIDTLKSVVSMLDGNRPQIGEDIPLQVASLIIRLDYLNQTESLRRLTGSRTLLLVQGEA